MLHGYTQAHINNNRSRIMKSQIRTFTLRPLTAVVIALLLLVSGWAAGTARNDE
jgi:hypothetical protein